MRQPCTLFLTTKEQYCCALYLDDSLYAFNENQSKPRSIPELFHPESHVYLHLHKERGQIGHSDRKTETRERDQIKFIKTIKILRETGDVSASIAEKFEQSTLKMQGCNSIIQCPTEP